MTAGIPLDRARMATLLSRFDGAHADEILTAVQLIEELRRASGLTWLQILAVRALPVQPPRDPVDRDDQVQQQHHHHDDRQDRAPPIDTASLIAFCRANPKCLTDWEAKFLASLVGQHRGVTPKQIIIIQQIARAVAATDKNGKRSAPSPAPEKKRRRWQHRQRRAA